MCRTCMTATWIISRNRTAIRFAAQCLLNGRAGFESRRTPSGRIVASWDMKTLYINYISIDTYYKYIFFRIVHPHDRDTIYSPTP